MIITLFFNKCSGSVFNSKFKKNWETYYECVAGKNLFLGKFNFFT